MAQANRAINNLKQSDELKTFPRFPLEETFSLNIVDPFLTDYWTIFQLTITCVILDLFARKVIAWKTSTKMDVSLIKDCTEKALNTREPKHAVIFHSDRGSQYTSFIFRKFLDSNNIIQSFSKLAHPWDNAVMESFFKYMKKEELNRRTFKNIHEVYQSCFEYIEGFYNSMRPHSANSMMTPNAKENKYFNENINY